MPRGSNNFKDLTGQKFGLLTVIRLAKDDEKIHDSSHGAQWVCKCDCGAIVIKSTYALKRKNVQNINCGNREKHPLQNKGYYNDLSGKTFKGLYVLKVADKKDWKFNQRSWLCLCECGNECVATTVQLTHGIMSSCGCRAYQINHGLNRGGRPKKC